MNKGLIPYEHVNARNYTSWQSRVIINLIKHIFCKIQCFLFLIVDPFKGKLAHPNERQYV